MGCRDDGYQGAYSEVRARRYRYQMRQYTEEPGAEQFACPVLDWRRGGRPLRRPYGKKRPLGMPVWSDKLVQEVIRLLLEAYFEPQFSDHSHGFRQERGCHTALREVYQKWKGTFGFIEVRRVVAHEIPFQDREA